MKAVILAAGQGTRLRPLTDHRPKALVPLAGMTLLERQLHTLRFCRITDICVLAGYCAEQIEAIGGITVLRNPRHEQTNMVATLMYARDWALRGDDDLVVCYGDIQFEPRVLEALLACNAPLAVTVDRNWKQLWQLRMEEPLCDAETLKVDDNGLLIELGKKPSGYDEIQGQYMGLFKISNRRLRSFFHEYPRMNRTAIYDGKDHDNMFMTSYLQHLIDTGWAVRAVWIENGWLEIDSGEDLACYERMYREGTLARWCDLDIQ